MDINQSALSNYQTKDKQSSRASSAAKSAYETTRSQEVSSSSQTAKQLGLKEGQIVKGQITDIRYNEVKVQLEPGKQVISAKLSGDVALSIGQNAEFQVTEEASDHLVLKYIPNSRTDLNSDTILKALNASGLQNTERNRILVAELLNHRMPIDKLTLQAMSKLAIINREATPLTLVLMQKNHIPITPGNVRQFEAYQNGTHQLLADIRTISRNIADIAQQGVSTQTNSMSDSNLLLQESSIGSPVPAGGDTGAPLTDAVQLNTKLIDILYSNHTASSEVQMNAPLSTSLSTPLHMLLSPDELNILTKELSSGLSASLSQPDGIPADFIHQLSSGTISVKDTIDLIGKTALSSDATGIIEKLVNISLKQESTTVLSYIMTPAERSNLLQIISTLPSTESMKEAITQGNASLREVLTFLQAKLPQMSSTSAGQLLQSAEYTKLLEEAFLQKWTITPENVAQKSSVTELFGQLKEDLEQINTLASMGKELELHQRIQEPMKNMQENLQFMKDLNDVYTYLQLPVQFKNQQTHTDLYVMTRKKALNDKRENLSVLLHLEMLHLGAVNVHIQMSSSNQIQADFYIENNDTASLIHDNLQTLTAALEQKGYTLKAEVKDTYQKPDFTKDFIEQNSPDVNMKRYTFDIRT